MKPKEQVHWYPKRLSKTKVKLQTEISKRNGFLTAIIQATKLELYFEENFDLINRAGGLYGRILTEVVTTDRTQ